MHVTNSQCTFDNKFLTFGDISSFISPLYVDNMGSLKNLNLRSAPFKHVLQCALKFWVLIGFSLLYNSHFQLVPKSTDRRHANMIFVSVHNESTRTCVARAGSEYPAPAGCV